MTTLCAYKYKTEYDGLKVYVDGFNPGDKACWREGYDTHCGSVAEVVYYVNKPDEFQKAEIDSIENYGYDCTSEFITDNGCYFVALTEVKTWLVKILHEFCDGEGYHGKALEKQFLYRGKRIEVQNFIEQFGIEKWTNDIDCTNKRYIDYEEYVYPETFDTMPEEYLRVNRPGWINDGVCYVPDST